MHTGLVRRVEYAKYIKYLRNRLLLSVYYFDPIVMVVYLPPGMVYESLRTTNDGRCAVRTPVAAVFKIVTPYFQHEVCS